MPISVIEVETYSNGLEVKYSDGSKEEIQGGIYERKNSANRTVEERVATAADWARLSAIALDFGVTVTGGPGDDVVVIGGEQEFTLADGTKVEIYGTNKIEVEYTTGAKEEIENGIYERKDINNNTVEERPATQADLDRLTALIDGLPGSGSVVVSLAGVSATGGSAGAPTGAPVINGNGLANEIRGTAAGEIINGLGGNDRIEGRNGDDSLFGGADNDEVRGDDGNDLVFGGAGNDKVEGKNGNDVVNGDDGNDIVKGGAGADIVSGGTGSDRVWGNLGADTFVFEQGDGADRIQDFANGEDKIDLSDYGLADVTALLAGAVVLNGVDTLLTLGGGDSIRITSILPAALDATDFIL